MPVTISFRGPMVVVTNGEWVSRILIPNAERPARAEMGAARSHILGVIHLDGNRVEKGRFVVPHGVITISEPELGDEQRCEKDVTVDSLASLRDLIDGSGRDPLKLKRDDDATLAACVNFKGGKLRSRLPSKGIYQFPSLVNPTPPGPRFLPLITDWTTLYPSATIDFEDPRRRLGLDEGDHVYLVNIDGFDETTKFPKPESMEHGQQISHIGTNEDDDFRLCYLALLPTVAKDFTEWLAIPDEVLPVPFYVTNPVEHALLQQQRQHKNERFHALVDPYLFDPDSRVDCMHGRYPE